MAEVGIDWWWIAFIVVIGTAAAAFDFEAKVLRWRVLVAIYFIYAAVWLAYNAIAGTFSVPPPFSISDEIGLAMRALMLAASAWALYLGVDALRTWWRAGDKTDE